MKLFIARFITALAAVGMVLSAASAGAEVRKVYNLAPGSGLATTISSTFDKLTGTGETPTWDACCGPYDGSERETKNFMVVTWENDVGGVPAAGPIMIENLDFHHFINAGLTGVVDITGQMDAKIGRGDGTMNASRVVTTWLATARGQVHNELQCDDVAPSTLCGAAGGVGLPEDGVMSVTHDNNTPITIDTLASPNAASLPMTFSADFSSVTFEMTIDESSGRQYYDMIGTEAPVPAVPVLPLPAMLALYSGIAASGGLYIRKRMRKA